MSVDSRAYLGLTVWAFKCYVVQHDRVLYLALQNYSVAQFPTQCEGWVLHIVIDMCFDYPLKVEGSEATCLIV